MPRPTVDSRRGAPTTDARIHLDDLVDQHEGIALAVARRFSRGRRVDDDLLQVARLGLVLASRRFDPDKGHFAAFATATASGEVKKYLRSHGWAVHVPRRLQEDVLLVTNTRDLLTNRLGRPPTDAEVAESAGMTPDRVDEATAAHGSRFGDPLDLASSATSAVDDDEVDLALVRAAVAELDPSQRELVRLRFGADLTQTEIGERIGISQAQVHRRLSSVLAQLGHDLVVAA